jgi:hypothetical protein
VSVSEHFVIRSRADSPELWKAAAAIEAAAWAQLGFLNFTRAHYAFYADLLTQYQLCLVDTRLGYPVATANCVPLACKGPEALPPEGWDWLVETAARKDRKRRNMLGALQIAVPNVHRSKGYARRMIHALLMLAGEKGLGGLIAPVRPSGKAAHPLASIDDYVTWTDEAGRVYDPWLRSHLSAGGKLIKPCKRSMVVEEPLPFWETWSNRQFEKSGRYAVDGALTPVSIDIEKQVGVYEEPNVWVAYTV